MVLQAVLEVFLEFEEELCFRLEMGLPFEYRKCKVVNEVLLGQQWIRKVHTLHVFIEALQKGLDHGCLAGADLTGEQDETLAFDHAVGQEGKGLLVNLTEVEEPWGRREVEGLFLEAVKISVHNKTRRQRFEERPLSGT